MNLYINHQNIFMRKINRSIISRKYRKYRKKLWFKFLYFSQKKFRESQNIYSTDWSVYNIQRPSKSFLYSKINKR